MIGGMGSFSFFYDKDFQNTLEIIPISEYQFQDRDGIPVLATLYSYSNGQLYELDIWKPILVHYYLIPMKYNQ